MIVLQIEHPVPNFNSWKKTFDSDPVNRKESGVRRYRVSKLIDNPNYVIVELEFDNLENAEALLEALKKLWNNVEGKIMMNPQSRIIEEIETIEY